MVVDFLIGFAPVILLLTGIVYVFLKIFLKGASKKTGSTKSTVATLVVLGVMTVLAGLITVNLSLFDARKSNNIQLNDAINSLGDSGF